MTQVAGIFWWLLLNYERPITGSVFKIHNDTYKENNWQSKVLPSSDPSTWWCKLFVLVSCSCRGFKHFTMPCWHVSWTHTYTRWCKAMSSKILIIWRGHIGHSINNFHMLCLIWWQYPTVTRFYWRKKNFYFSFTKSVTITLSLGF